ncbi:hypothetical protein ACFODZ_05965 [Marinicella sediminis]|uniref:Uncharacterized protein n=1 Tax=Marinicella sediminis TaxID=1792834 RepID=A0ABV7JA78_9GAMM|nr:hypothetical protein [Marinicella sediminis]
MFEHIAIFFSIILSLGLVHLLGGLSLMLDARIRNHLYWVHLLWTLNLLFLIALVWFANFALAEANELSLAHYFVLLAYAITIYLLCGLLFPVRGEEVVDFRKHYYANSKRFAVVGMAFVITDACDGLIETKLLDVPLNYGQFGTLGVYFFLFLGGLFSQSHRYHACAAVVFGLGLVGFLLSLVGFPITLR